MSFNAYADWVIPPGSTADLGGGTVSMGCTNVVNQGLLSTQNGSVLTAKDIEVLAGAQLVLGAGRAELAQQWQNEGTVTVTTGQVIRVASLGCDVTGQAGPIALQATPSAEPVAVPTVSGWAAAMLSAMVLLLAAARLRRARLSIRRLFSN